MASLVFVPVFRYLKLSPVLGYILSGVIIGPEMLGLIDQTNSIVELAEIGITLLLFVVGLELSPMRLKALRSNILYLGGGQVVATTLFVSGVAYLLGMNLSSSIAIGLALSLSSTAFALSHLTKSGQLTTGFGQVSLSILLFQDLIIVPVLALLPILSVEANSIQSVNLVDFATRGFGAVALLGVCFYSQKHVIPQIKRIKDSEVTLASFLLFIIGMTMGMEKLGFSMSIGAFIAGLFLANSEVKNDLYKTITPFKGILMGLFFMTLGLGLNFDYVQANLLTLAKVVTGVCVAKGIVLAILAQYKTQRKKSSVLVSVLLLQVGEFGIVVLERAGALKILSQEVSQILISSALITMILSPLVLRAVEFVIELRAADNIQDDNVIPIESTKNNIPAAEETLKEVA